MITTNPASFYIDHTYVPIGVSISVSAYPTETKLSKHTWHFDDDSIAHGAAVQHFYSEPGIYDIKHIACDYANHSYVTTKTVTCYTPYHDLVQMSLQPSITAGIASTIAISITSTQPPPHNVVIHLQNSNSLPARSPRQFFDHLLPQWGFYQTTDTQFANPIQSIAIETVPIVINGTVSAAWCGTACVNLVESMPGTPTIWATLAYSFDGVDINSRAFAASSVQVQRVTANTTNSYVDVSHDGLGQFHSMHFAGVDIPVIVTIKDNRLSWPYIVHYANMYGDTSSSWPYVFRYTNDDGDSVIKLLNDSINGPTSGSETSAIQHCVAQEGQGSYFKTTINTCSSDHISGTTISSSVTAIVNSTSIVLTGTTPLFHIRSLVNHNQVRLQNEDFDMTDAIKRAMPEFMVEKSPVLFEQYLPAIFGNPLTDSEQRFGIAAMERISNFITNHSDVDTCTIDNVYSTGTSMDLQIDKLQITMPGEVKRLVNIASINPQRLWGTKCGCNMTFDDCGDCCDGGLKCTLCKQQKTLNRGDKIDTTTYTVTAGVPIVYCPVQTRDFALLYTIPVSGSDTYAIDNIDYTNLSTPLSSNYVFYHYLSTPAGNNIENLINWSNCQTLLQQTSSQKTWLQQYGTVEEMARYLLTANLRVSTQTCPTTARTCEIPECS